MVKTVAHDVGYESESQFSREYRRFFGATVSVLARAPACTCVTGRIGPIERAARLWRRRIDRQELQLTGPA
ncbi:AraC family transcriptional regulator [Chondromyces apiculatus]|uniref:Putative transcriptional regulator YqhC n=1 Tax=Chondromyces apiculatus DSM 436 TaxID=1192034 RepID=A0A017T6C7_9BACT|nr:AraC family transcriptional regulator [Chondromyces apiculatus]EYF04121.1 putative transcriptional regulator YqhC [Chondromyces apiculatus DSM 436]